LIGNFDAKRVGVEKAGVGYKLDFIGRIPDGYFLGTVSADDFSRTFSEIELISATQGSAVRFSGRDVNFLRTSLGQPVPKSDLLKCAVWDANGDVAFTTDPVELHCLIQLNALKISHDSHLITRVC
jgi:hypothetical protein